MTAEAARGALEELRRRHPDDWERVSEGLLAALSTGRAERVAAWLRGVAAEAGHWRARVGRSGRNPQVEAAAAPALRRERMARMAVEKTALAMAARESRGVVRLGIWSGLVAQRLLFAGGLRRKAVSMAAFRLLWPLVPDRRLLMPLVQPRGIYCFYSRELVRAIAARVGARPCLEVAAGDGTLARLLGEAGLAVRATDDGSWGQAIAYPPEVERLEAREALERHAPRERLRVPDLRGATGGAVRRRRQPPPLRRRGLGRLRAAAGLRVGDRRGAVPPRPAARAGPGGHRLPAPRMSPG